MNKHTISDLYQMQSLPLSAKIRMSQYRIRQWVDYYGPDGVYVSFSGGKDSTVLLHMVREMYPEVTAVYVDTGLEYPEVKAFVKEQKNVEIIRPKMSFREVISRYGYPMIGKEVAEYVYGARRYVGKLKEREQSASGTGTVPNYSYAADLTGIDRREDKKNAAYQSLRRGEIPLAELKAPVRYLILQGKYPHKENGVETSEYSKMYNKERYRFFLDAPFEISNYCCTVMKKAPMKSYARRTGKVAMTGQMASESRLRTTLWLKNGCNGFEMKNPVSNPLSFWTEQDVLAYVYLNRLPIASVYGEVTADHGKDGKGASGKTVMDAGIFDLERPFYDTTGCDRTGCVFCGFGCHREKFPNRWEVAERFSNPDIIDYMMRGGAFDEKGIWKPDGRGLGFWFVIEWINLHGCMHIILPHRERYLRQYMTEDTEEFLAA